MKMTQIWGKVDVKEYLVRRKIDISILLVSVSFGVLLGWDFAEIVFFAVFIWSIIGPIRGKWLALFASIFLFSSPMLFLLDFDNQAEKFSIYAYYFMVMMVIRGIIEVREGSGDEKNITENDPK